jgi:hypothetical protein
MTDRDTFAAAALTGLLAAPTDKDRSMDYWARLAYEAADAMLRERGGTEPMPKEKRAEVSYTLTAEEREAIHRAEARLRTAYVPDDETAATLRELLARLA